MGAVGEAEQQIADALQADHELHAGEQFARLGGGDLGDGVGDAAVDFHVELVEFFFALAEGIEQGDGAGGDAFGGGSGRFFGHLAGLHREAHQMAIGRFGYGLLEGCAHASFPPGRGQTRRLFRRGSCAVYIDGSPRLR